MGRFLLGGRLREARLGNCGSGRLETSSRTPVSLAVSVWVTEMVGDGCAVVPDTGVSTASKLGCSLSLFMPGSSFGPWRFPFTPLNQPQERFRLAVAGGYCESLEPDLSGTASVSGAVWEEPGFGDAVSVGDGEAV